MARQANEELMLMLVIGWRIVNAWKRWRVERS